MAWKGRPLLCFAKVMSVLSFCISSAMVVMVSYVQSHLLCPGFTEKPDNSSSPAHDEASELPYFVLP